MINIIAAIGLDNELGKDNDLLWSLPSDMKHFRELTTNNFVIMGRKTHESIGKCLPNRTNIVISRNTKYKTLDGAFLYNSFEDVLNEYYFYNEAEDELFIIGGGELYKQAIPFCDRMYLTIVEEEFKDADAFFPKFNASNWNVTSHETIEADENNKYRHHFITYERKIHEII